MRKNKKANLKNNAILLIAAAIAIIGAGYYAFILFMTKIAPETAVFGIALVAVTAGIATFFNPCSFGVLPAYLTRFLTAKRADRKKAQVVYYGIITAAGIVAFNLLFGSLIGLLGENFAKSFALATDSPNASVLAFRGIVGILMITFGAMPLLGKGFHSAAFDKAAQFVAKLQGKTPARSFFVFGFGYNIIGIGCAGPILAILTVFAFATGGFLSALLAYAMFSATMAALMILLSFLATISQSAISELSSRTQKIRKISSVVLLLVGIYLLLSSIFVEQFVILLFPR
ncbi:hypothetical protein HYX10_04880 [Candidatus Woesearchaeota archaeon]|nr:hypothetical protein [Candidatus Woesearchaeota archaeon]